VSTIHYQVHWHRFYCHALYEQSLATDPASTADKTSPVPDLHTVHFVVWFGDVHGLWTLLQEDLRKLEAFHMCCQRMILGIRWHDFVRNTEVVDRTNLPFFLMLMYKLQSTEDSSTLCSVMSSPRDETHFRPCGETR